MASHRRIFRCWNCGSENHKLSDCDKEVLQVNKNFWRKMFRLQDSHERDRHKQRYLTFLLRLQPNEDVDLEDEDWLNMTREEVSTMLFNRHLAWQKRQWKKAQEMEESEVPCTSSSTGREEDAAQIEDTTGIAGGFSALMTDTTPGSNSEDSSMET